MCQTNPMIRRLTSFALAVLCGLAVVSCASHKTPTPEEIMAMPDARMNSIILTDLEIVNARVDDAVRYLAQKSIEADPDKLGVKIQYRHYRVTDPPWRVNLRMQQATVRQAIEVICQQARCNYLVGKDMVTVMPEDYLQRATGMPR